MNALLTLSSFQFHSNDEVTRRDPSTDFKNKKIFNIFSATKKIYFLAMNIFLIYRCLKTPVHGLHNKNLTFGTTSRAFHRYF